MTEERSPSVQATETSFRILETVIELDGANNTEIADHLNMTKSTVYNHLQTLLENKYIVKNENEYDIGLKFLRIGEYARSRHTVSQVGPPEIDKLAEESNELANLVVEEHGEGVFIYRAKGSEAVHMDTHTGMRLPLHMTAFGKAILAHLPESRVTEIIDRYGLSARTENTITRRDELYEELERIQERGYAFDREERLEGLCCVAAPIVANDRAIGAVSVSGPRSRMQGDRFTTEIPELVSATANVIEVNITFQ